MTNKVISIMKGSKVQGLNGKLYDVFGFQCVEYARYLDKVTLTLLARESGVEYVKMGVAMVYNAPVYWGFNVENWDGAVLDAGRLKIRLEKLTKFNEAWGCEFDHCQMTVDPVGGQSLDILRRDQLVSMLALPSKI